jgi:basic membrane lipoprotein Med (substrate-binding protein (PBP1-ABC) superfamily)
MSHVIDSPSLRSKFVSRFFLAAVVLHTIWTAGCGRSDRSGDESRFRVGLITPGPVSDQAWNSGAYQGLLRIRDSLGAEISNVETENPSVIEETFRQYGAQGYDLVIGHGFEFQDPAARVGPEFPKTVFVATGGNRAAGNFISLEFAFEEGSYLAGMIAASITKSRVLGCIGGTELPPVARSFRAFESGARSVDSGVRVLVAYVGNWSDASAGKEHALAQIGRGADVIFGNADAAGLGVFQAAKESGRVRIIGANSDQAHVAPDVVIGSVVIDLPHAFLSVAQEIKAGGFVPRVISFGTKSDVVRWVYNPALRSTVPEKSAARVDSVTALLRAGTFSVQ